MNLENVLKWIVIGGVFSLPFLPLIVAESLFFPFITGKNFTFRIIVEIMTAAWLALALVNPIYRPRRSWMLVAIAIFVFVIGLADIFAENPIKAIWSNYERMEGWITLVHLLAYFTVTVSMLNTEKLWKRLWQTSIGVSVLVGAYGIFQLVGFITINQGGGRLDATFGNATYLAVYMLFHIFLTALLWAQSWGESQNKKLLSLSYGVIIALQTFILFFTATRGAMLGLVGGTFLSALVMIFMSSNSKTAWRASVGIVVAILILVGSFFALKNTSVVRSIDPLARIADISFSETTVTARFMNWGMAWEGVKERPILGWGQDGYNFVFNKYYNPGMYAQEPWFDRVHNIIFDWLIAGGIIGFLSYVSIWGVAMWLLWGTGVFTIPERSIFTGLLAGYGFHNLFVFDQVVSYILFISVLAYLTVRVTSSKNAGLLTEKIFMPKNALPFVAAALVLVLWGTAWGVNAKALAANRALLQAVSPQAEGVERNLELFEESIAYNSLGKQEAREHLIQGASQVLQNPEAPDEIKQIFYDTTKAQMELQIESVPNDARFPLFLGLFAGRFEQHEDARAYLERALELSPKKQTILFQVGANAFVLGDVEKGLESFKVAYELEPEYEEAHVLYAAAAVRTGRDDLADGLIEGLLGSEASVDGRILNAYVSRGLIGKVGPIWEKYLEANPENIQAYFSLSAVYYSLGQTTRAINTLEELIKINPAVEEQARILMEQIRNGSAQLQQ